MGPGAAAGLGRDRLGELFLGLGAPEYRADQVMDWIHAKGARDWESMTNLPRGLRAELCSLLPVVAGAVEETRSDPDGTLKLLIRMAGDDLVESVLLSDRDRLTACISTQVGCPMGCRFCASGAAGLVRDLDPGEIVSQLMHLEQASGRGLDNVVVMGMGEPLLNFDSVAAALGLMTAPQGRGMSPRRITLSTVGPPGGVERLTRLGPHVNLAVSMHAADDRVRAALIPAKTGSVPELAAAAGRYRAETGMELTFECVLLRGVNDSERDADRLGKLALKSDAMVNLLPWNPVGGAGYEPPRPGEVDRFHAVLTRLGVRTHRRRRRGEGIDAACGQLRLRRLDRG